MRIVQQEHGFTVNTKTNIFNKKTIKIIKEKYAHLTFRYESQHFN